MVEETSKPIFLLFSMGDTQMWYALMKKTNKIGHNKNERKEGTSNLPDYKRQDGHLGTDWVRRCLTHRQAGINPVTITPSLDFPVHTLLQSPRTPLLLLFGCSVMPDSLRPHGLQHARLPCPSPSPRACANPCPLSSWCHPTILSSVVPFSSCLLSQHQGTGTFRCTQNTAGVCKYQSTALQLR